MATIVGNFVIPAMIVPILARPNLLDEMLATIDYPIEHLVIIDNGHCVKEVTAKHVHNIHIVTMPSNLGVAGSWNLGIKSLPFAAYWLIANFDVTWPAGSLERFAKEATAHELVLSGASPPWAAFALGACKSPESCHLKCGFLTLPIKYVIASTHRSLVREAKRFSIAF